MYRQPSDYRFESEIQADLLEHFGAVPYMRIWRQNVGKAYPVSLIPQLRKGIKCRPVMFGQVGQCDILGFLTGDPVTGKNQGRFIGIEVKMPGEKLRPEQLTWRDMMVSRGAIHILATCIDDVYAGLRAAGVAV